MANKSEELAQRIELCKSCDQLNSLNFCKQCGCFMPAKIRLKWTSCPIGKWKAIGDPEQNPYTGLLPHEEYKLRNGIVDDNN